eukprot:m.567530 g.567530  ORF g.567530 m.567530 type:complete len:120 (+) comp22255_c0_seq27:2611-2970(+)
MSGIPQTRDFPSVRCTIKRGIPRIRLPCLSHRHAPCYAALTDDVSIFFTAWTATDVLRVPLLVLFIYDVQTLVCNEEHVGGIVNHSVSTTSAPHTTSITVCRNSTYFIQYGALEMRFNR